MRFFISILSLFLVQTMIIAGTASKELREWQYIMEAVERAEIEDKFRERNIENVLLKELEMNSMEKNKWKGEEEEIEDIEETNQLSGHITEGDVNLQLGYFDSEMKIAPTSEATSTKRGVEQETNLWNRNRHRMLRVPFVISAEYTLAERLKILFAIKTMNDHLMSCNRHGKLVWIPRTHQLDYVKFNKGPGCASFVGKIGGPQELILASLCTQSLGIILHEMLHVMGFQHEHQRTDRDKFVEVIEQNIIPIPKFISVNFNKMMKMRRTSQKTPYDYQSVLHYGPREFARQKDLITIKPKQKGVIIGQRIDMSVVDQIEVRKVYRCFYKAGKHHHRHHHHSHSRMKYGHAHFKTKN